MHSTLDGRLIAPKKFFVYKLGLISINVTAHTDSQSEMAKVGAVSEASTTHPFISWRYEMRGKMELG